MKSILPFCLLIVLFAEHVCAHSKTTKDSPVHITKDGKLEYKTDEKGNRVPDYSYCGYMASEESIPDVPVKVIVSQTEKDATFQIQSAIDYVASMPIGKNGFRGAVLLEPGIYKISGNLRIYASGIVLRGSGCKENGTILIGTGKDRETLIQVSGKNNRINASPVELTDEYIPVNTSTLKIATGHNLSVGDRVFVTRPSTQDWIESIGADKIGTYVDYHLTKWLPGDFDINWERTIVRANDTSVTLDAPLTNAIDPAFGRGWITKFSWEGRIHHIGIENLWCKSDYDKSNLKDENHRWMAITLENVCDSWVRRVVSKNFVSSAVAVWETARRITIEDCKSLAPIGEIGNYRRYSFQTSGQQVLFQRCYAEYAYHAFSVGFTAPGPNAFVQCYSYLPYHYSGATGGWSNGVLFDKMTIDGGNIFMGYRDVDGQGGGWTTANSMCWQCKAAKIYLSRPPGEQNWAYASWAQGYGNGHHEIPHTFVKPESLYYAQLETRTGKDSPENKKILTLSSSQTTAPTPDIAKTYSTRSKLPEITMNDWIDSMVYLYPLKLDVSKAIKVENLGPKKKTGTRTIKYPCSLINGWLTCNNKVIAGTKNRTSLWKGSTRPSDIKNAIPNIVRFVPGRSGQGLTDNLDTLIGEMINNNVFAMQHFPALWYERRRDDHARTRRADADVWPPFYEQPFSRSGQGEAFDRLSKYDLDSWNTWYWIRLKQFADLADQNGLLLIQEHYLQHNIIEEGAHWADYPWRTANNINNIDFPENTFYAGDKRVYMAEQFYDTANTVLNRYHRNYIRKCLDNFKDNTNVIHHLGAEYTGPLHFVQFWLDVIKEWEIENHRDVLVMLPGTKDVQDAILSDPVRSQLVDIVDIVQWHHRKDGSLYAPTGGENLAGRQYARLMDVGKTSFEQIYRAAYELKLHFPDKAVVYSHQKDSLSGWAVLLAGGSFAQIPKIADANFYKEAINMKSISQTISGNQQYILGKKGLGYIIFSRSAEIQIDLSDDNSNYVVQWIDPISGKILPDKENIDGGKLQAIKIPTNELLINWLHK